MGKLGEKEDEDEASNKVKKRVHRLMVGFGRERTASRLPYLSLGLGDDRRSMLGSGDASLAIYITFVRGSESLTSFTNSFIHFSGPTGFRMAFDGAGRN